MVQYRPEIGRKKGRFSLWWFKTPIYKLTIAFRLEPPIVSRFSVERTVKRPASV